MFIFHYILDTDFPSRRDYLFPIQSFKKKMWTLCSKVNPWIKWLYKSIDLSLISWNLFVIGLINGKWFPQEIFIFFGQFRCFSDFLSRRHLFYCIKNSVWKHSCHAAKMIKFHILNIDWKRHSELVLLVLSSNCFTILIRDYRSTTLKKKNVPFNFAARASLK